MSNSNEILAKIIDEKLKAEGLINSSDKQLVKKLSKGQMKDSDWKVALEEITNKPKENNVSKDETE
jgi:hypothetical protein